MTERSSCRGVPFVVIVVAVLEGRPQGGAGLLDAPPTEVAGVLVESPIGLDGCRFGGEEMQLRFHGSQYGLGV